jgi:predicted nucleotidyltransferase/biotin operon repressor
MMSEMVKQDITVCIDAYPDPDTDVFRVGAADDILRLLVDAHDTEFSIPELVDATGVTRSTVWRAVDLLDSIDAIRIRQTPQRNYIAINPDRLQKDDPILGISQSEFHAPIRAFVDRVQATIADADDINDLLGIVIFGSVARGEADRQSDIDCFVVVDGDRTTARRLITDVVADLQSERFDGDRFVFEPYVESAGSAERAGSKLNEIFAGGITVYGSDRLDEIRKEVIADE